MEWSSMYSFDIKEQLDKKFQKLSKKNPTQLKIIHNKIQEVIQKILSILKI